MASRSVNSWKVMQVLAWMAGLMLFIFLIFLPQTGTLLLWNILIPLAPAILVVAAGLWRNICPLATTVLIPNKCGLTKVRKMNYDLQGKLSFLSVVLLFVIVPLRHYIFNFSGITTAALILLLVSTGVIMSLFFESKSGWCSSLCPIHPVEKLYARQTISSFSNAHCNVCVKCVTPCPDSTPQIHPLSTQKTDFHQWSGMLITGGLPGFIWGWFQIQDHSPNMNLLTTYGYPIGGMLSTLCLFYLLKKILGENRERLIINIFAASAVSFYYIFRIPGLLGFGKFETDGLLINLTHVFPLWSVMAIPALLTLFFFWWIVIRKPKKISWLIRPVYQ